MWRFLIVGVIFGAAAAIELKRCGTGGPMPLDVRSSMCNNTHCEISRKAPIGIEIDTKIPKKTVLIFPSIMLYYKNDGHSAEKHINIDVRKGCKNLVSHTCPLRKGAMITWVLDWDFLPEEDVKLGNVYKADIVLHDEFQERITCARLNLVVVP